MNRTARVSNGPLSGKTVVVTRSRAQAGELADRLEALGAKVLEFPTIQVIEPEDWGPVDAALRSAGSYDWIVFTSANAVEAVVSRLASIGLGTGALAGTRVAAVGPATAARCAGHGIAADFIPDEHRAEGLLEGLTQRGVGPGARVLIPRALEAREVLPETLRERGATVDVVPVYRTVRGAGDPVVLERLREGSTDVVTFTSSSTVRHFVALTSALDLGVALAGVLVASIGPVTSRTARDLGLEVGAEAEDSTIDGLVRAVRKHFTG